IAWHGDGQGEGRALADRGFEAARRRRARVRDDASTVDAAVQHGQRRRRRYGRHPVTLRDRRARGSHPVRRRDDDRDLVDQGRTDDHRRRLPRNRQDRKVKRSTDRILTTHVGSLARPHPLLEVMRPKAAGEAYDAAAFARLAAQAVEDVVRQQVETGIDVVSDGEQSKAGFLAYVAERLSGLEPDTVGVPDRTVWQGELDRFPEYYREYLGGKTQSMIRNRPLICTGPVTYQGQAALQADIDNLRNAIARVEVAEAFMPSI